MTEKELIKAHLVSALQNKQVAALKQKDINKKISRKQKNYSKIISFQMKCTN